MSKKSTILKPYNMYDFRPYHSGELAMQPSYVTPTSSDMIGDVSTNDAENLQDDDLLSVSTVQDEHKK